MTTEAREIVKGINIEYLSALFKAANLANQGTGGGGQTSDVCPEQESNAYERMQANKEVIENINENKYPELAKPIYADVVPIHDSLFSEVTPIVPYPKSEGRKGMCQYS